MVTADFVQFFGNNLRKTLDFSFEPPYYSHESYRAKVVDIDDYNICYKLYQLYKLYSYNYIYIKLIIELIYSIDSRFNSYI